MEPTQKNEIILGYWNTRGRAELLRLLMEYLGIKYIEKKYDFAKKEEWFNEDKNNLGLEYPNLPYLIDGDLKITEMEAIATYIATKANRMDIFGKNDLDRVRIVMLKGVLTDIQSIGMGLCFQPDFEESKISILKEKIYPFFERLSKSLGEKVYFLGYITYADFYFYWISMVIKRIEPKLYESYPNLNGLIDRIDNCEMIISYKNSERNMPRTFFSEGYAKFNFTI